MRRGCAGVQAALKVFKNEDASPDGRSCDEIAVMVFVSHACLTRVEARVTSPAGIVMGLVPAKPMAEKPNFESLLRCRWAEGAAFSLRCAAASFTPVCDPFVGTFVLPCTGDILHDD